MLCLRKQIFAQPHGRLIHLEAGLFAMVDESDYVILSFSYWRLSSGGPPYYAYRRKTREGKTVSIKMHRQIMNTPANEETHHKNGDSLDNRRENLANLSPLDHRIAHGKSK